MSATHKEVTIVNIDGPHDPTLQAPAVRLIKRDDFGSRPGNVVCVPVGLEGKAMFGGAYVTTSDSRFAAAVRRLSGYTHGFPVALHDRVEKPPL